MSLAAARPALTIFLGAFLLFTVEPLIAKWILPWFGGSSAVWTACLLFFQVALLAGYLYAHALGMHLKPVWQARVHWLALAASLVLLPIGPSAAWKPQGDDNPLLGILGLLTVTIGLPFMLLAATGPLVQAWLARERQGAPPYRLYAVSNLGSMLALLAYPVLVEPSIALHLQAWIWSGVYVLFAALFAYAAWRQAKVPGLSQAQPAAADLAPPSLVDRGFWVLLAAAPSALLLAVTNHITQNIAAVPLLWVVPLALYLLSFIVCFASTRRRGRAIWCWLFAILFLGMVESVSGKSQDTDLGLLVAVNAAGLFVAAMVCHGELAAMRPPVRYLTQYYLAIAAGGALGGIAVAVAAPAVFDALYDLPILLPATALLAVVQIWRTRPRGAMGNGWVLATALATLTLATLDMAVETHDITGGAVARARNFYGPLRITQYRASNTVPATRQLTNGTIDHGEQLLDPARAREPTTYYGRASGLGLALHELEAEGALTIGAVGLGTGTAAAYCRPGDRYYFYEINPQVLTFALRYFTFLKDCPGDVDVALGDARLSLEREPPRGFDLLFVDAFTGDAIPTHLLTAEAFALYRRHLKPDGVLAIHVSNNYLDLAPVVAAAAAQQGMTARTLTSDADPAAVTYTAVWTLATSRPGFFDRPAFADATEVVMPDDFRPWTDDYSNLWAVMH